MKMDGRRQTKDERMENAHTQRSSFVCRLPSVFYSRWMGWGGSGLKHSKCSR